MFDWLLKIKEYQFLQVNMKFPVSPIYIWSEIFMSPSEAKFGGHELRRFQSPYAVFHVLRVS